MKKRMTFSKINSIFEVEDINLYLKDFNSILEDKEVELTKALSESKLESLKTKEIKDILVFVVRYNHLLKTMKNRIAFFSKNSKDKIVTEADKELIKNCNVQIANYLSVTKKLMDKCYNYLACEDNNVFEK